MSQLSIAWSKGYRASNEGLRPECNPYLRYTEMTEWARGFAAATRNRTLKAAMGGVERPADGVRGGVR